MSTRFNVKHLILMTAVVVIALVYAAATGYSARPAQGPGQNPHAFVGTWLVQTSITDCSGTTLENFSKLLSIDAGGTAHEISSALPPSQRTVAFGVWQNVNQRNFVYALRFFRFTPGGVFTAVSEAKWNVLLDETADSYEANATIKVTTPNGTLVANLCGTENGTRMQIPE